MSTGGLLVMDICLGAVFLVKKKKTFKNKNMALWAQFQMLISWPNLATNS